MERLCACLISMAISRSKKQNSILFSFQLKKIFWKYPKFNFFLLKDEVTFLEIDSKLDYFKF